MEILVQTAGQLLPGRTPVFRPVDAAAQPALFVANWRADEKHPCTGLRIKPAGDADHFFHAVRQVNLLMAALCEVDGIGGTVCININHPACTCRFPDHPANRFPAQLAHLIPAAAAVGCGKDQQAMGTDPDTHPIGLNRIDGNRADCATRPVVLCDIGVGRLIFGIGFTDDRIGSRKNQPPAFAAIFRTKQTGGSGIDPLRIDRMKSQGVNPRFEIDLVPAPAAVVRQVGAGHVANQHDRVIIVRTDGRQKHGSAAAGSKDTPRRFGNLDIFSQVDVSHRSL